MIDLAAGISSNLLQVQQKRESLANFGKEQTVQPRNTFSAIFDEVMGLVGETDNLASNAEKAEIDFSLGNAESTHEVAIAQQKALVSLQYTVAIKNALVDAYKEIMNIQM